MTLVTHLVLSTVYPARPPAYAHAYGWKREKCHKRHSLARERLAPRSIQVAGGQEAGSRPESEALRSLGSPLVSHRRSAGEVYQAPPGASVEPVLPANMPKRNVRANQKPLEATREGQRVDKSTASPDPAFVPANWVAERLGMHPDTFRRRRAVLARAGFPEPDPLLGRYLVDDADGGEAGADLLVLRDAAGHLDAATTNRYMRGREKNIERVVKMRNKT